MGKNATTRIVAHCIIADMTSLKELDPLHNAILTPDGNVRESVLANRRAKDIHGSSSFGPAIILNAIAFSARFPRSFLPVIFYLCFNGPVPN
jgi:hypothetical protein